MQIKYLLTESDMMAFNLHTLLNSKDLRRRHGNYRKLYGVCFVVFALVAIDAHIRLFSLGMALWCAYCYALYSPYLTQRRVKRHLKKHFATEDYRMQFCEHTLEITADGLVERTPYKESKMGWIAIQRIESDDAHTYVYVGPNAAFILPHRDLLEGDLRAFLSALRTHYDPNKTLVHSPSAENLLGG